MLWELTDRLTSLLTIVVWAALIAWAYRGFLQGKRRAILAVVYAGVMGMLLLLPVPVPNLFAWSLGSIAVFLAACLLSPCDVGESLYLAVMSYLLRWIAAGLSNTIWQPVYATVLLSPRAAQLTEGRAYAAFLLLELFNVLLCGGIFFLLLFPLDRVRREKTGPMRKDELFLLLSPLLSIAGGYWMIRFLTDRYASDLSTEIWDKQPALYPFLLTLYQGLSYLAILSAAFFDRRLRTAEAKRREAERLSLETEEVRREVKAAEAHAEELRRFRHDVRHHFAVLSDLLREQRQAEAAAYLSDFSQSYPETARGSATGHPVTDVVLNQAAREAKTRGISFSTNFFYPARGNVDAFDVSTLLKNALKNAFTAAEKSAERKVAVTTALERNAWVLLVTNSFTGVLDIDVETGLPRGLRTDGAHGYGLSIIQRIAEHYAGTFTLTQEEQTVTLSVLLLLS